MRREESGYCSKQSFCHVATNTQKDEAVCCESVTNRNCMLFILISSAHPELNRLQLVPEPQPGPLNPSSCVIYTSAVSDRLSRKWRRSQYTGERTREIWTNSAHRPGSALVHLCGASSPTWLENWTLPSSVNPPSCCDISRRSWMFIFLFQTTSEPCHCATYKPRKTRKGNRQVGTCPSLQNSRKSTSVTDNTHFPFFFADNTALSL